ncbi:MAG: hypothetical protein D6732_19875 [Methanobacteriota archaeon]|nr:MAG: hypothetical protein D6732_19875 [Euryarchaeota archaeon]
MPEIFPGNRICGKLLFYQEDKSRITDPATAKNRLDSVKSVEHQGGGVRHNLPLPQGQFRQVGGGELFGKLHDQTDISAVRNSMKRIRLLRKF